MANIQEIKERFDMLDELVQGAINGRIRGLVVAGAPGIGKSFGIEKALRVEEPVQSDDPLHYNFTFPNKYRFVKGHSSAAGLYELLYEFREENAVLALDDCDSIFQDKIGLNILKAALDTTARRVISWQTAGNQIDAPKSFEFKGSLIFITNINFRETIRAKRSELVPHLEAILDRCFYMDLGLETCDEKFAWVSYIARDQRMLARNGFTTTEVDEILEFFGENHRKLTRLISLRKVQQVAEVYRTSTKWQDMARCTVLV